MQQNGRRVRLVATDMDGTLLGPDGDVSERTMNALRMVREQGIEVVLVTGRPPRWVSGVLDDGTVHELVICSNGAIVYDPAADRVVQQNPITTEITTRLITQLRERAPGVTFALETATGFGYEPDYPVARPPLSPRVADALELARVPTSKLLVRHPALPMEQLRDIALEVAGDDAVVTHSGFDLIEISAAGITKAYALERLCHDLGISADEVIAFGDMPNDLPMLAWAGYSVAVANAHPSVLESVDEVTAPNGADGVALVLERVIAAPDH